ncbi:hypothetical protein ACO0LF_26715 [Undibacterium sp. Di27W]|uniref:hypothetical protein n=1 Tax=Undibacterium sp. Di27W TaxID=3413036 RepID=UPI003BF09CA9
MKTLPLSLSAIAVAAMMTGCVVAPRPHYYAQPQPVYVPQPVYAQPNVVVVEAAPPAPYAEVIGVAPTPGYIWIGGAWFWEGGRHVWHRGYWSAPRSGHFWVEHRWEQVGHSWHFREGHWEPHRR